MLSLDVEVHLNPSWDFESNSFLGRIALNSKKLGET